jgi:hypothetical protein
VKPDATYAAITWLRERAISVAGLYVKTMEQKWMNLRSAIIVGRERNEC